MKQKTLTLIIAIAAVCTLSSVALAQFAPPSASAPTQNVLAPLNIGNGLQTRNAAIVVANSDIPLYTDAGFVTDTGIVAKLPQFLTTNAAWSPLSGAAFDTNAPVSVNGLISAGALATTKSITTESSAIGAMARTVMGGSLYRGLCAQASDGKLIPCPATAAVNAATVPDATITVSPQTLSVNTPARVTVSWSSTNSEHCYPVGGGYGFATNGAVSGVNQSRAIILSNTKKTADFGIVCRDAAGNSDIAIATVSSTIPVVVNNPIITLSVSPTVEQDGDKTVYTTVSIDENGGTGTVCSKDVDHDPGTNPWTSAPVPLAQFQNSCENGCLVSQLNSEPYSSYPITVSCSNAQGGSGSASATINRAR
jgi:hypothetical protein